MLIEYSKASIYQEDKCVLKEFDFRLEEGEFVYLIGKVGSGKSSFLKTLYCELDIDSAEKAVVLERDLLNIKSKHIPELRREMGIVFQDFQLLHDRTVLSNLEFVLKAIGWKDKTEIAEKINQVLESVGMQNVKNKLPHELSGGEQQRVAIARALLNNPKIIVADEPTGNLDPETAEAIIILLKEITRTGTAVIMSTHNIPMLDKIPGIVYNCENGTMTELKA
ncbi:MAG: ATP-binding cassette domain-containing protein [Prevotella sp.]|jgi:cell division transport system ATP-binding protein|nr:ATP-binding cassette domain-containing protein [Prevotella sp.]MEE1120716.1 ATP-binding cassette domain-containing protein [Prevotella sp.]